MANFDEWDFATAFTPSEAVLLIGDKRPGYFSLGLGPISTIVFDRMKSAYEQTRERYLYDFKFPQETITFENKLQSVMMNFLAQRCYLEGEKDAFQEWINGERSNFHSQKFTRKDIKLWLVSEGLTSAYKFVKKGGSKTASLAVNDEAEPADRWPWGGHHTKLLGHLDAAARMFWSEYDPANRKATAPKSTAVVSWLVEVCGVSQTQAIAMASVLRADGLKVGPRK